MKKLGMCFTWANIVMLACFLSCCENSSGGIASNTVSANYLINPTGAYSIGFKDYDFINTNLCPDPLYSESIAQYFSPSNTNHCHQLAARVYYPILNKYESKTPYDLYYMQNIQYTVNEVFSGNIPESIVMFTNEFLQISPKASYNAPLITNSKFPVIIFTPGFGVSALDYQNLVLQLVSNGYIIAVVNSAFIATFQIPGNIVPPELLTMEQPHCMTATIPGPGYSNVPICNESQQKQLFSVVNLAINIKSKDINYVLNYFENASNNDQLALIMDFNHIGILGHSIGAQTVVKMAHETSNLFNAIAALDPFIPESNGFAPIESFAIPCMIVDSAQVQAVVSGNLANNNYFVGLTPNKTDFTYSAHFNFTDSSTLQYPQIIHILAAYYGATVENMLFVGQGNGYDIANNVNTYLLSFFNMYLKNQQNQNLTNCTTLTTNTYMLCNSGNYAPN